MTLLTEWQFPDFTTLLLPFLMQTINSVYVLILVDFIDNEANNTNLPLTVVQRLKSFCF